jgi:16S rRNA (cytidine1402-2'-O)-methyltransferase
MGTGKVYLIPSFLYDDSVETIPAYVAETIKDCQVFFVENERSARRYLKKIWKEIVIDDYEWYTIHKAEHEVLQRFTTLLKQGRNIGIISEAGCPGIADPGQLLVEAAQQMSAVIKPLVGPSSILLALMASGMNGQCFQFHGYLPIDNIPRKKAIRELEADSAKRNCTQVFIETPYRNNQIVKDILESCREETRICIAVDITAPSENIKTKTVKEWKRAIPDIHKKLAIFLLHA